MVLGQEPRQATSNLGHLNKPSIQVIAISVYSWLLIDSMFVEIVHEVDLEMRMIRLVCDMWNCWIKLMKSLEYWRWLQCAVGYCFVGVDTWSQPALLLNWHQLSKEWPWTEGEFLNVFCCFDSSSIVVTTYGLGSCWINPLYFLSNCHKRWQNLVSCLGFLSCTELFIFVCG